MEMDMDMKMEPVRAREGYVHGGTSEEGVMCSGGASEEGFDEELSVLPRHTKVIVTGNNRTKSVLVGLKGVVKKAVGLGGWHWLVLTNGLEVKLQRNALSVLEPPTGLEDDNDSEDEDNQRPVKARIRAQKSKNFSRSAARCHIGDASPPSPKASHKILKVNLNKLETETLWRYWRRFILVDASPHLSKEQLVDAVERHFISQE